MSGPEVSDTIREALLDPRWETRIVSLGVPTVVLTLVHPRHGPIHSVMTAGAVKELRDLLNAQIPAPPV